MSHDKIKAAARRRAARTGEPYATARRAVVTERRAAGAQIPSPGAGYALRMSGEIHDWLADLSGSDPAAAMRVGQALAALMNQGASLGDPLVVSTADSWPWALAEALDRSYQEGLERLQLLRRRTADAVTLVRDIQDQLAELESAQAKLEDIHRRAQEAARPQEAAQAASKLAAAQQEAAEARRLLPGVIEARHRLEEATQRRQARANAARTRKEILKASCIAAHSSLLVRKTIAASLLTGDDDGRPEEDSGEAISTAEARLLRDVIAQMEQELGQQAWPEGLLELRPDAPDASIRVLFAIEPPGTALLIAVLEGLEAVRDQYGEALLLSADMLRQVRAGQAPEAAEYAYDDMRSFLEELYPGNHDDADTSPQ